MNLEQAAEGFSRAAEIYYSALGMLAEELAGCLAPILEVLEPMARPKPVFRPPVKPRPAQRWELRSQVATINPILAWQRCPQRHRARESRGRWKEMQAS